MGTLYAFPYTGRNGLVERWHRIVERWQRGGVEDYALSQAVRERTIPPAWHPDESLEISEHRISLARLPAAFHGFRIVQITDIHHGLFLPLQAVADAVALANALEPDLVVLTGDFVTYSPAYIEPVAFALGRLRARHGVYAVLGNHDFRVGAGAISRALRQQGIEVLRNQHTALRRRGERLHLAGIDDLRYRADLSRALRGIPEGSPTILLSHNPDIIHEAAQRRVNLVLSGHTHGGQVNLPLVGNVYSRSRRGMRFKAGWDCLGATQIYVSRGIGTVVVPLRYRCPAEIPHLHLLPEPQRPLFAARRGEFWC
jgi:predicted MPP superfamily phosphohydrolase